jgi:hypothetical protein
MDLGPVDRLVDLVDMANVFGKERKVQRIDQLNRLVNTCAWGISNEERP